MINGGNDATLAAVDHVAPASVSTQLSSFGNSLGVLVPVANDGSWFGPHLQKSSGFSIGKKGQERVVLSFEEALENLTKMPTPYWRRPNKAGNWGIVSGVRWAMISELQQPFLGDFIP